MPHWVVTSTLSVYGELKKGVGNVSLCCLWIDDQERIIRHYVTGFTGKAILFPKHHKRRYACSDLAKSLVHPLLSFRLTTDPQHNDVSQSAHCTNMY